MTTPGWTGRFPVIQQLFPLPRFIGTARHRHRNTRYMSRRAKSLVTLLFVLALAAVLVAKKKADLPDAAGQQKRALHALDRLTFGPRPGDVQRVATIGVDQWIEQQLRPDQIDNSSLDARLAIYRTLHMSSRELPM